jgi:hypothetical protein
LAGDPRILDAKQWARTCRIEATKATDSSTKQFLLELAAEYDVMNGEAVVIDFDDHDLQNAVAERLMCLAAKRRAWVRS